MRQFFLFLVFFLGLFWVVDAIAFDGVNSAGAWQEATHLGQKLSRPVLDQARQYLVLNTARTLTETDIFFCNIFDDALTTVDLDITHHPFS